MALNPFLSDAAANAAANAVGPLCNGGTIEIRSGTQPASANAAATGTLLVTLTWAATAFGAAAAGVITAAAIGAANAVATGTAAWFRAKGSGGATVFDGSVGASGCDINLSSVNLTTGGNVALSSFTYTQTE